MACLFLLLGLLMTRIDFGHVKPPPAAPLGPQLRRLLRSRDYLVMLLLGAVNFVNMNAMALQVAAAMQAAMELAMLGAAVPEYTSWVFVWSVSMHGCSFATAHCVHRYGPQAVVRVGAVLGAGAGVWSAAVDTLAAFYVHAVLSGIAFNTFLVGACFVLPAVYHPHEQLLAEGIHDAAMWLASAGAVAWLWAMRAAGTRFWPAASLLSAAGYLGVSVMASDLPRDCEVEAETPEDDQDAVEGYHPLPSAP